MWLSFEIILEVLNLVILYCCLSTCKGDPSIQKLLFEHILRSKFCNDVAISRNAPYNSKSVC